MRNSKKWIVWYGICVAMFCACVIMAVSLTGCGSSENNKETKAPAEDKTAENAAGAEESEGVSGTITMAGSVDIGNSSRNLKDSETGAGAVENIVAIDGIAVMTNTETPVGDLTKEQLSQIYKGEITDWSDVGGDAAPIVVIGREAGSGTRGAFEEILRIEDACAYASELDSTGAVMATNGSISEQSPAVQKLFSWMSTEEGKELITSVGLITVD